MALFKIFKGLNAQLPQTRHEGYAYFVEDTGALFIDVSDSQRVQVNALNADKLKLKNGDSIEADEVVTTSDVIGAENGGTGQDTLTVNAVLIGNGTDPIKMVKIPDGAFVLGSETDGLISKTKEEVRQILDVYTKAEVNTKVDTATTVAYSDGVLSVEDWASEDDMYTQTYSNSSLKCGNGGTVPPIVTYASNRDEYSKIDHADATPGEGIKFYIKEVPKAEIKIIVIDVM